MPIYTAVDFEALVRAGSSGVAQLSSRSSSRALTSLLSISPLLPADTLQKARMLSSTELSRFGADIVRPSFELVQQQWAKSFDKTAALNLIAAWRTFRDDTLVAFTASLPVPLENGNRREGLSGAYLSFLLSGAALLGSC